MVGVFSCWGGSPSDFSRVGGGHGGWVLGCWFLVDLWFLHISSFFPGTPKFSLLRGGVGGGVFWRGGGIKFVPEMPEICISPPSLRVHTPPKGVPQFASKNLPGGGGLLDIQNPHFWCFSWFCTFSWFPGFRQFAWSWDC